MDMHVHVHVHASHYTMMLSYLLHATPSILWRNQTKSGHDQRHQLYATSYLLEGLPSLNASEDACQLKTAMGSFARACKWCFRPQHATWEAYRSKVVLRAATLLFKCAVDMESVSLTNSKG